MQGDVGDEGADAHATRAKRYERRLIRASIPLVVLLVSAFVLDNSILIGLGVGSYVVFLLVVGGTSALEQRRALRRWRSAPSPRLEFTEMRREPGAIVLPWWLPWRIAFIAIAAGSTVTGIALFADGTTTVGWQLFGFSWYVLLALVCLWFTRFVFVATDAGIAVRAVGRPLVARWDEVASIEPTPQGFRFRLYDGRGVTAITTSKTSVLRPRYDKALLAELRSRIPRPA